MATYFQCSCVENPMNPRGAWNTTVYGVAKSRTQLRWLSTHIHEPFDTWYQFSLVQSCLTLCNPMDCGTPGFPALHQLPELTQTHVHRVGDAIQFSHPLSSLLLPPSVFPSIRVFSNESVLRIRWPKCWSFSFSISPSNEYSGLISFRMDWLDLLAVQRTLKMFSNTTVQKHQFFSAQLSL